MVNGEVIRQFYELAELTKLEDGSAQSFRVRAYEKAVHALENLTTDVRTMTSAELKAVDGVGKSTAEKVMEYVTDGVIAKLPALREKYPPEFVAITRIPGVGPKTAVLLRDELDIHNVEDLRTAIANEQVRELPGLGAKSEAKIAKSIERLGLHGKDRRTPIHEALPVARGLVADLEALPAVSKVQYCGSLRRFRETIGDIDIVVAAKKAAPIMEWFVSRPIVEEVIAAGDTKTSVLTAAGLQIDLRVVAPSEFGAAVLYFTGSKAHNIELRQRALDRGWTLNEYALSDQETEDVVASRTEKAIYSALDMAVVPPPLREGQGEVQAAADKALPRLVSYTDLRADLHVHSAWSGDGRSPLEDMLSAQAERGLEYMALTDHGEDLTMNGLSRDRMLEQRELLGELQNDMPAMRILHGCELNIGRDGSLDYDPEFLLGFDYCVASVHSHFDLDAETQTRRIVKAMESPAVNAIGHLSGRRIGKRPGIEFDVDMVLAAAEASGTAIEINGHLERLDATPEVLRHARGTGVVFAIDTDAHHVTELENAYWGVENARRGWVEKKSVVNTWPLQRFLKWVEAKRSWTGP